MNISKLAKHLLLVAAYSWVYIGCYSEVAVKPNNCSDYITEPLTVETKGGQLYRLEIPWAMDSLQNVCGKGEVFVEDDWRSFDGFISGSDIEQVTVVAPDGNRTGIVIATTLAVGVAATVYIVQLADRMPDFSKVPWLGTEPFGK